MTDATLSLHSLKYLSLDKLAVIPITSEDVYAFHIQTISDNNGPIHVDRETSI
jgi:hypothetical protein